jgi:U3 small nucleolar RNA-associated protein 20
LSSPESQKVV